MTLSWPLLSRLIFEITWIDVLKINSFLCNLLIHFAISWCFAISCFPLLMSIFLLLFRITPYPPYPHRPSASYTPAVALVVMCFVNCNSTLAIVVLCVAVGCTGFLQREHPYGTGYRSQPGGDARRNHQHRRICHGVHCSGCGRRHHEGKCEMRLLGLFSVND